MVKRMSAEILFVLRYTDTAIGAPSSPCSITNAFCASMKPDAFIVLNSSPSQEMLAENSSVKWSSSQGAEQPQCGTL